MKIKKQIRISKMNLFNQNYYMQIYTHSKLQLEKKNKKQKKPKQNKTKQKM